MSGIIYPEVSDVCPVLLLYVNPVAVFENNCQIVDEENVHPLPPVIPRDEVETQVEVAPFVCKI